MTLDLHHDFTFNPDGSGRVTVRWAGPLGEGAPTAEDFVRSEIERATGVDAWADVSCGPEDGQLVFTGTAWFPDCSALRFHCQGFHASLLDFVVTSGADGSVAVATLQKPPAPTAPTLAPGSSDAEAKRVLAEEREKLAMARGFLDGLFGSLRCSAVLRLPGPLVGSPRGERLADNAVRVQFEGAQLVQVLDRLMNDDALMLRLLRQGGVTPEAALDLLGDQGPVALATGPGATALFDYAGEVAVAREQFAAFAESLRAAVPVAGPAEPMANVRLVACKVVFEADSERDLCPQGQNHPGVTLTIAGDLPQTALDLDSAGYEKAIADDGTDFTPGDEWDRRCHFPKLTKDGRTVYLDLELKPPAGARGLGELSGRLTALCSDGQEQLDLGFEELVPGATGTVAGAMLVRVEQEDEQRWCLEVQVQVARQRVLGCVLTSEAGSLPLEQTGYSSCNDECTFTYRLDGDLPTSARLVMTFAANLSRLDFGFALQNVDWLGRSL